MLKLQFIRTEGDYDFYFDRGSGLYNIVPKDTKAPEGGYASAAYILAIKGVKQFRLSEEAHWYFLGAKEGGFFRNVNFKKRDYNCTNLVAVEILADGKVPASFIDNYELSDKDVTKNLSRLYIQDGIRYWGYL